MLMRFQPSFLAYQQHPSAAFNEFPIQRESDDGETYAWQFSEFLED